MLLMRLVDIMDNQPKTYDRLIHHPVKLTLG